MSLGLPSFNWVIRAEKPTHSLTRSLDQRARQVNRVGGRPRDTFASLPGQLMHLAEFGVGQLALFVFQPRPIEAGMPGQCCQMQHNFTGNVFGLKLIQRVVSEASAFPCHLSLPVGGLETNGRDRSVEITRLPTGTKASLQRSSS